MLALCRFKTCLQQFSDDLDTSSSLPMLNTSCESEEEELGCGGVLNDSGSDSGISNPCTSTWKRVGGGGGDATPSPDSPTLIEELVTSVVEDVVANAQLISSAATDSNSCSLHLEDDETAPLISNSETVLPVEAVVIHQVCSVTRHFFNITWVHVRGICLPDLEFFPEF